MKQKIAGLAAAAFCIAFLPSCGGGSVSVPGPGPGPNPPPSGSDQIVVVGGTRSTNYPTTAGALATAYQGGTTDGFVSSVRLTSSGVTTTFSTYFGGSGSEEVRDAFVDGQGNIYITGITDSPNFPTTAGAFQRTFGGGSADGFVAKLSPTGQLLAATFVGGSSHDQGYTIVVDAAGFVYIAGRTASLNYPVTAGAFRGPGTYGGGPFDMHVTKLRPDLSGIVWATYLGGSNFDSVRGRMDLDAAGNVYISGNTESNDFPGAAGQLIGTKQSVVAKISADGSQLIYARLVGGHDSPQEVETFNGGLKVLPSGEAYACGFSSAQDLPNPIRSYGGGVLDSVIVRLSPAGQVLALTYLGGNARDECEGITLDASGNVVVTTMTDSSTGFPTTQNAFQRNPAGGRDLAVTKLSPDLSQIIFSTLAGASGDEFGDTVRVELDSNGNIYFAGYTSSAAIPWLSANAVQSVFRGARDGLIVVMSADGQRVLFATYLGGSDEEIIRSIRYRRN